MWPPLQNSFTSAVVGSTADITGSPGFGFDPAEKPRLHSSLSDLAIRNTADVVVVKDLTKDNINQAYACSLV
jgi:uncharacterized membrane protein YgcG